MERLEELRKIIKEVHNEAEDIVLTKPTHLFLLGVLKQALAASEEFVKNNADRITIAKERLRPLFCKGNTTA